MTWRVEHCHEDRGVGASGRGQQGLKARDEALEGEVWGGEGERKGRGRGGGEEREDGDEDTGKQTEVCSLPVPMRRSTEIGGGLVLMKQMLDEALQGGMLMGRETEGNEEEDGRA